ncbi:MAG TPA: SDR family NAD(P)-dependent oxidoreductase, partial [Herpetosiphonaceae bacterium]|nr:SDR family NAD(P)-dependent oxidoreductase [Herpetosiphonaceae bacterium]
MRLAEKVAIVTGAGSGIGRAIAGLFAREGARVVVADRDADRAAATVAEIAFAGGQAIALTVDVTEGAAVERMAAAAAERFGRIDVLVNNAAYSEGDDILTMDEAMWDRNMDIVLKSVFLCSKAVLPRMIDQGRGAIVNISSVNGMGTFGEEAYSAAKAGVNSLSRNMATK